MVRVHGALGLAALIAFGAGCGGESLGGGKMMPPATGGSGVTPGTGGTGAISGILGTGGAAAGGTTQCGMVTTATAVAPVRSDILVVFDRSATMADDANEMRCSGGCGASSKWSLLTAAMENVIAANTGVNWGLALFGGDQACGVPSGVDVNIGPGNLMPIVTALATAAPAGEAPAALAIYNASNYLDSLANLDTIHPRSPGYIVLVSDGLSSCSSRAGEDGASVASAISAALSAGWPTFVVGMAPESDAAAIANLNLWAATGREAKEPENTFYAPADLAGAPIPNVPDGAPCTMTLSAPPAPGVTLAVSVTMSDGTQSKMPQDPMEGWTFGDSTETSVGFNGSYCEQMKTGQITSVSIYYDCPVDLLRAELRAP